MADVEDARGGGYPVCRVNGFAHPYKYVPSAWLPPVRHALLSRSKIKAYLYYFWCPF